MCMVDVGCHFPYPFSICGSISWCPRRQGVFQTSIYWPLSTYHFNFGSLSNLQVVFLSAMAYVRLVVDLVSKAYGRGIPIAITNLRIDRRVSGGKSSRLVSIKLLARLVSMVVFRL